MDFNGGGDDLDFTLFSGGDTELGEDLLVWLNLSGCSSVGDG